MKTVNSVIYISKHKYLQVSFDFLNPILFHSEYLDA